MSVLAPLPSAPFGFVEPDCAFRASLDHLFAGWHEELAELPPGPVAVVSELRGRRTTTGWALGRVSSSLQVGLGGPGTSFHASTLHWCSGGGPARWAVFPDDSRLDGLGPALAATTVAPAAPVTCHGDLVPSSPIGGPGRWTVVDLEQAHRGEPSRDLAMSLAALPSDVPALAPATAGPLRRRAAEEAYLRGYEERSGRRLGRCRLAWFRAAAELHHLGSAAVEDRWGPRSAARAVALVDGLLEESA